MEQNRLISELNHGKEFANQLMKHMNPSVSSKNSLEMRQFLVEKILSSYENALLMLNSAPATHSAAAAAAAQLVFTTAEAEAANNINLGSPNSSLVNSSPRSEISDQDSKDQCYRNVFKKRKTTQKQPKWTEEVQVCSGTGLEGPVDDGYSWRKYGQKDILGANHPRGYYRCTHRHSQGCLATKHVQRSDENPSIFKIIYRVRHTCMAAAQASTPKLENAKQSEKKEVILNSIREELKEEGLQLKVKTDESDGIFRTFSFRCDSDVNFLGELSHTFLSPTTSDQSNYFCHQNLTGFVQTPESGMGEIISAPTSVANSPIGDWDFSIDDVDFDPNLSFDNLEFLG